MKTNNFPKNLGSLDDSIQDLPDFAGLTIRQLIWLKELRENSSADISNRFEVPVSTLSKELNSLGRTLQMDWKNFANSENSKILYSALEPLLEILHEYSSGEVKQRHLVRVGSGGSLLAWLLAGRVDSVRDFFISQLTEESKRAKIHLSCRTLRNREVVEWLRAGALDFGLVRTSLFNSLTKRHQDSLMHVPIGDVSYGLIIPERIEKKYQLSRNEAIVPFEVEEEIFQNEFFTTVWPEGEFRARLDQLLKDVRYQPQVEFSYRSFPQTIPHLLAGTHVAIAPYLPIFGAEIPGCYCYKTEGLNFDSYKRNVSLVAPRTAHDRELLKGKPPEFEFDKLADLLRFGTSGSESNESDV